MYYKTLLKVVNCTGVSPDWGIAYFNTGENGDWGIKVLGDWVIR